MTNRIMQPLFIRIRDTQWHPPRGLPGILEMWSEFESLANRMFLLVCLAQATDPELLTAHVA